MEDGTTQGKMKKESMISQTRCCSCNKYDHYAYECRSSTNNMEGQANYVEKKDQEEPIVLLAYKGESKEKSTHILTPKQTITCVVSKTCL